MKHLHDLPAWSKLWIHFDETKEQHMREMFEQDPDVPSATGCRLAA